MSQVPPDAPLPADSEEAATDTNTPAPYKSPLPVLQLAILCAVRLMDPVTFTQIFPYINQFLTRLHLVEDQSQIGFYSGLVLISIYQWAKLSESIGRRPIVVGGTFGLAFATTALGLSSSLWTILLSRALAGLCSGNAAVLHSVLGELTDSTNQHIAFPLYGLFWPLGSILGPILGGSLANPADKYPILFGYQFLRDFPYFLPCLSAGLISFATAVTAAIFLKETHPDRQPHAPGEHLPSYRSLNFALAIPERRKLTLGQLLSIPIIRSLSISGASLCFTATAFDAVFVLFCYTSIPNGGLNFSVRTGSRPITCKWHTKYF
ncbi:hypothetical protein MD484_g3553, partial [Candolleomyces efflorescens]